MKNLSEQTNTTATGDPVESNLASTDPFSDSDDWGRKQCRSIVDTVPQLIWTATPDGNVDYYNQRWVSYTGMPEQVKDSGWKEVIHPDDRPEVFVRWTKSITTECDFEMELRLRRGSDGAYRWFLARAFPRRDPQGKVIRWVASCTDLEEQRQARNELVKQMQELAASKQKLDALFQGATNVSIIATNVEGIITVFNSGAENLLGYRAEEVVGKHTPALFHLESEVTARGRELAQQTGEFVQGVEVFRHGARAGRLEEREWTYAHKDGRHLAVNLALSALRDPSGAITGFLGVAMDVTARRRAEAEARKTEQHFRLIVESVSDYALLMLDPFGHVVSWNSGAERIKGYEAAEILGKHFSNFYPREERERHHPEEELRIAAEQGRYREEGWRLKKDGSRFWAEVVISAVRDESGKLQGFAKVTHDITERKLTAERFQLVVEAAPSAMIMVGTDGLITLVNTQTERLFGYTRGEMLGQALDFLLPERFRVRHGSLLAGFFSAPSARAMGAGRDLFGLHKNGSEIPIEIGLNPIRTSEGQFVLASVVDITERKLIEERFQLVVEASPSAMIMVGADGLITLVNSQAERIFGYGRREMLRQPIKMLLPERFRSHHDSLLAGFFAAPSARAMGAGRDLFGLCKNGNEIPIEIGLNPVSSSQGQFVLASIVDITERKRAAAALAEARHAIELRLQELAATNQELADKNEEVEAFVYIVSHDLRAPLVNLQGFCKELETSCTELREYLPSNQDHSLDGKRIRSIISEDMPESLRFINSSTTKFSRLINALLELSRYGRQIYKSEEVDLNAVAQSTLDLMRLSIAAAGVQILLKPVPKVYGDATALGQVFANLVSNAIKYLQPGRLGRIEIGGESLNGEAHCWVIDNGAGIPAAAKGRLFQVFQRFHPSLADGEGMGLALVRRIIERHGGRIWAEGEENEGTAFHFTLPRKGRDR